MRVRSMLGVGLGLLLAGAAGAESLEDIHSHCDANRDGEVDRAEYQVRQKDLFFFQDKDKDGALEEGELEGPGAAELIRQGDRDGDGRLELDEWLDARGRAFSRADADKSGTLSVEEVRGGGE